MDRKTKYYIDAQIFGIAICVLVAIILMSALIAADHSELESVRGTQRAMQTMVGGTPK